MAEDGPGVWLTLAELAARSGRDRMAVRSWVRRRERNGLARTRRGNQGQTQVWATPELLAELTDRSGRGPTRDQTPGPAEAWPPDELAALREELGESRELAARTAGELAAEQRRNAELVETLTAALARAEARADRLEAEHRATVAELRAEMAEARRPWLARVLEGLRRRGS